MIPKFEHSLRHAAALSSLALIFLSGFKFDTLKSSISSVAALSALSILYILVVQQRQRLKNIDAIICSNADAWLVVDMENKIRFVNTAAEKLLNKPRTQLLGQNCPYPLSVNEVAELEVLSESGKKIYLEIRVLDVDWENVKAMLVILRDVSERRLLQEQFLQSQKMETVGHLAGGIAHDFNNLLTVIHGYSECLMEDVKETEIAYAQVKEIRDAATRASNLTRQLLTFSRRQIVAPKVFNLNQLILDMERMLKRLLGEPIEFHTRTAPDLGMIKMDPGQMEQVLMNMGINARDAMPNGGQLTLETHNLVMESAYVHDLTEIPAGEYVMLAVTDNGVGMEPEIRRKVFEPFFTTKDKGRGTGLGLSTCYGIVKQAGGVIQVYSEPGVGTSFKILLPRCYERVNTLVAEKRTVNIPGGTETLLLVEDETSVRKFASSVLTRVGYRVIEAGSAEEALRHALGPDGIKMDLLITDVILPQMQGRQLAEQMAVLKPKMKMLFTSGYTDDTVVRHGILSSHMHFIQKPFGASALCFKVREILDQSAHL